MPKYIQLEPHLNTAAIEEGYRQARDIVERSRWQVIRLIDQGRRAKAVAAIVGYSPNWVRGIVKRYNAEGPASLRDGRHDNPGGPSLLSAAQHQQLYREMTDAQKRGEAWNGPQVAQRMSELLGQPVHAQRGWEQLQRWWMSPKVPRPAHVEADPETQEIFKKTLSATTQALIACHADRAVELWAMDEHRLGLQPILRRVWSPIGERPIVPVEPRYEWLYVYGFVQPTTGRNFWLLMPTVTMVSFSIALRHVADFVGAGPDKTVRLVVDQAGFHTGHAIASPGDCSVTS